MFSITVLDKSGMVPLSFLPHGLFYDINCTCYVSYYIFKQRDSHNIANLKSHYYLMARYLWVVVSGSVGKFVCLFVCLGFIFSLHKIILWLLGFVGRLGVDVWVIVVVLPGTSTHIYRRPWWAVVAVTSTTSGWYCKPRKWSRRCWLGCQWLDRILWTRYNSDWAFSNWECVQTTGFTA